MNLPPKPLDRTTADSRGMIFVRATKLTPNTLEHAQNLHDASGLDVAFILDGRHPITLDTPFQKVLVTAEACAELGLYCPPDFAWRCGDYGLYLARRRYPDLTHMWLIEYDVRLIGGPMADFFALFAGHPEVDFIASRYRKADGDWDWRGHARGWGVQPYQCVFSMLRISGRAVDALLPRRVRHGRSRLRRKTWPNDEGFVATTLSNGPYVCRDLNNFGREVYDETTFALFAPKRGETLAPDPDRPGARIYHPVLFGVDFERGNLSAAAKPRQGMVGQFTSRLRRSLNALLPW